MSERVPEGWAYSTLSELCSFSGGSAFKEIYQGAQSGEYPFIKVSDMNLPANDRFIVDAANWISANVRQSIKAKAFPKNSVVFAKVGAALLLNRRRILTRETCIDNNMMAAQPMVDDHHFLYYLLQDIDLGKIVQSGAVPSVNQGQLNDICTLIPPLPEQQKIAKILTSVDEVIEKTQAQIGKLKDLKTGMMQELLTQGVGIDGKPHTEFKDSPAGRIPKAWEVVTLGDITIDSAFGPRFSSNEYAIDGNIGCIRTTDMDENWDINYATAPRAKLSNEEFEKHFLEEGDLLVTRSGTCGLVDVFKQQSLPMIAAAFLIRFRLLATVNPHFVRYLMMSSGIQENIQLLASGGVQKNLSGSSLKTLKLPMPDIDEQSKIVNVIESINRRLFTLNRKQIANQQLKKALMQDLLTGKVRVTID